MARTNRLTMSSVTTREHVEDENLWKVIERTTIDVLKKVSALREAWGGESHGRKRGKNICQSLFFDDFVVSDGQPKLEYSSLDGFSELIDAVCRSETLVQKFIAVED